MTMRNRIELLEAELGNGYTHEEVIRLGQIVGKLMKHKGGYYGYTLEEAVRDEILTLEEVEFAKRVHPLIIEANAKRKYGKR